MQHMQIAKINEDQCVGCTKCLPACPVDAIIGAQGFMHTVLIDECIGCKLCVAPCPMECIEIVERIEPATPEFKATLATKAKDRYKHKIKRLQQRYSRALPSPETHTTTHKSHIKTEINAAIARVRKKRTQDDT